MKEAFKNKKTYIVGGILLAAALIVSYGLLLISLLPEVNMRNDIYEWVLWAFLIVYLLVGFVFWDLTRVHWRKKTKNYDGPVDEEVKIRSWKSSIPLFLPALILLVLVIFNEIFYEFVGNYPFIG